LALVVGSEGRGIAGHIRRRIDLVVRIPMRGQVGSLNAAVAGSVLLFEASAQRPAVGSGQAASAPPVSEVAVTEADAVAMPAAPESPAGGRARRSPERTATPTQTPTLAPDVATDRGAATPEAKPRRTRRATPATIPTPGPEADGDPSAAATTSPQRRTARAAPAPVPAPPSDEDALLP
jgi:hypothetical protein